MPTYSTSKTKSELVAEIEKLKKQLDKKKEEEKYDDIATDMRNMYNSFVNAGFTEDQAWELVRTVFENGTKQKYSKF
jgi:hypothetical protein